MSITSFSPLPAAKGKVYLGQVSVEITRIPGSFPGANQQPGSCFHCSSSMRQSSCRRVSSDKRPTNPVWGFLPRAKGTATPARPDRTGSAARRKPRRIRQADREPTRSAADARQAPEVSARAAFGRVDSHRRRRQKHRNAARNRKTEGGADQGKLSHPATFQPRKPPKAASCPARSWGHRVQLADDLQPLTHRRPEADIFHRQTTACSLHHSCSSTRQGNSPRLPTPAATRWARPRMFCRTA